MLEMWQLYKCVLLPQNNPKPLGLIKMDRLYEDLINTEN